MPIFDWTTILLVAVNTFSTKISFHGVFAFPMNHKEHKKYEYASRHIKPYRLLSSGDGNGTSTSITTNSSHQQGRITSEVSNVRVSYWETPYDWINLPRDGLAATMGMPYLVEYVPNIDFSISRALFAGSGREDFVAALFESYLILSSNKEYEICITSDDGSKLYLDNLLIINNDGLHGDQTRCAIVNNMKGQPKLAIEYWENTYDATMVFTWKVPGSSTTGVVPPEAFGTPPPTISPYPTSTLPPSESPSTTPDFWVFEAEDANEVKHTGLSTLEPGYTGTGFLDFPESERKQDPKAYIQWDFSLESLSLADGTSEAGFYNLFLRYGAGDDRPLEVMINDDVTVINYKYTDWKWQYTEPIAVFLVPGMNRIRFSSIYEAFQLDHIRLETVHFNKDVFLDSISSFEDHMDGKLSMTDSQMTDELDNLYRHSNLLITDCECLDRAMGLIKIYENIEGPLFINDKTEGGFDREWNDYDDGLELERSMLFIQQVIVDKVYQGTLPFGSDTSPLASCDDVLNGRRWETSNFFPGFVDIPAYNSVEYSITINATMPAYWGMHVCFANEYILKPTGLYLSPGGIAAVEVTSDLVQNDYWIQVGASVSDNSNKRFHLRMDRVTSTYYIKDAITSVGSPLGGGIYIKVPYLADQGIVTVKITGDVVQAPIFSMTGVRTTSSSEWNNNLRHSPAPWADFETDIFLMQVPTIWVSGYYYNHIKTLLEGRDTALTGISELVGVPIENRNKHVLYLQPDLHIKHDAYGVGYPQVNTNIRSGADGPIADGPAGRSWHWLVATPFLDDDVCWHELGHCIIPKYYRGETEAIVNFPFAYVRNVHIGDDFDTAFKKSQNPDGTFTPDNAAVDWMVTTNFRNGKEMDRSDTEMDQFRYQEKGYAKYADLVRLFNGWQTFEDFNFQYNLDNEYGFSDNGLDETDDRTLRLSIAAGADLTPLIHFWGIHPVDEVALKSKMIEYDLSLSSEVSALIARYITLIPMNKAEFLEFFEIVYPGKYGSTDCQSPLYGCGWYNEWSDKYTANLAKKAVAAGTAILEKYYGDSFSPMPTSAPTCRKEKKKAKFFTGKVIIKPNGKEKPKTKTCKWLRKAGVFKISKFCRKTASYELPKKTILPAKDICTKTCNSCGD